MAHLCPADLSNGGLLASFRIGIAVPGMIALELRGREVASTQEPTLVSALGSLAASSALLMSLAWPGQFIWLSSLSFSGGYRNHPRPACGLRKASINIQFATA